MKRPRVWSGGDRQRQSEEKTVIVLNKKSVLCVSLTAGVLMGWQSMMATLGWTDQDKSVVARQGLLNEGLTELPGSQHLKRAVKDAWDSRPAADRVVLMRELSGAAKTYAMAPGFEKTYDEWIRQRFNAVNHGIKVDPQAESQAIVQEGAMEKMMAQVAAQAAAEYMKMPMQSLEFLFPNDLKNWQESDDPNHRKLAARAKAIAPLMKSSPEEFKKQYAILKSVEMGGPDTLAGIETAKTAGAQSQADSQKKQEQRAYDEHRLRPTLKKRLGEFVAMAKTVDFGAQTATKNGKIVFVNPAYERKPRAWKQMFRLGKEPVPAAVSAAEGWMREL